MPTYTCMGSDKRLAAIIREVLGKDTKTTKELDMLSRYLGIYTHTHTYTYTYTYTYTHAPYTH